MSQNSYYICISISYTMIGKNRLKNEAQGLFQISCHI